MVISALPNSSFIDLPATAADLLKTKTVFFTGFVYVY